MSKESESYRLQMLRRLEDKYGKAKPAEVLEAEKVIAKHRAEQEEARNAIPRLRSPLPEPNLCSPCWFIHGRRSYLVGIPHLDHKNYDRMKCPECKEFEDRDA